MTSRLIPSGWLPLAVGGPWPSSPEVTKVPIRLSARVHPLASLAFRDYRLLFIGGIFSGSANQMRQAFNLYLVYDLSGSALLVGFTGIFQVIPALTLGLFAGALADVFDRRKMLMAVNAFSMIPPLAIGALLLTDNLEVWHVFGFTSVTALINVAQGPARNSLVPKLVPPTHLMNAVTLNGSLQQVTFFFGPLLGGLMFETLGGGTTYIINAFFLIPAAIMPAFIRTSGKPEGGERPRFPGHGLRRNAVHMVAAHPLRTVHHRLRPLLRRLLPPTVDHPRQRRLQRRPCGAGSALLGAGNRRSVGVHHHAAGG